MFRFLFHTSPYQQRMTSTARGRLLNTCVEPLESRRMLAAQVTVGPTGDVTVLGTANDDTIAVFQDVTVKVSDGLLVQDTGLTEINNLNISTLGGNDTVVLQGLNITRFATINTGAGDDLVVTNDISVLQNVFVATDAGNDTVLFGGQVAQNLTILTGSGNSTVSLGSPSTAFLVGGNVTVTGGTATDVVVSGLYGLPTTIGGNLHVTTSSGDDTVVLGLNSCEGEPEAAFQGQACTLIGGHLVVLGQAGDDTIVIGVNDTVNVGKNMTLTGDSGEDLLAVTAADVQGNASVLGGVGANILFVTNTVVNGDADLMGGANSDVVAVQNSTFHEDLRILTLGGDDTVAYDAGSVVISSGLPRLTIDGGTGANDALLAQGTAFQLEFFGASILGFEIT